MGTNIIPHQHSVSFENRLSKLSFRPKVFWFTGLSGSGKSTLSNILDRYFFDESIRAQNQRKHEVLSRMSPNELVGADGAPQSENAAATIFNLEQEQAEKLKKNKERHERRKTTLQREGAFRVPVELAFKKRALQASHGGELHPVANFEGSRVVSALDGRAYPMGTVAPASRHSLSVQLPPRLQRPGKWANS